MEGFIGLLLTFSIFSVIMYILVMIAILAVPIIAIAIVVYLVKESKKGNETGISPIRQTEKLTKNEIVGDEEAEPIRTEKEDFLDFDAGIKRKF